MYPVGLANRAKGALIQWETGHCFLWASHSKMLTSHSLYRTKTMEQIESYYNMLCSEMDKSLEVDSIYVRIYVEHFPVAIEDTELER